MRHAAALLAFTFFACGRPCPHAQPLTSLDGGAARCVEDRDCPAPSSVLICSQSEDRLTGCITCEATVCQHYTPGSCP
jgi:hypothetical protein